MENQIEILENGTQFYMPDPFTGNTLLFEVGPDKSGSIQIIDNLGTPPLSICLWPKDLERLMLFISKQSELKIEEAISPFKRTA